MRVDLTPVRDILQLDGGDVELVDVGDDATTLHLRLILDDAGCSECVLPRSMLESIALKLLKADTPGLRVVVIDDPRETGAEGDPG